MTSFLCSKSSLIVNGPFHLCFLELLRKWLIQLSILNVLKGESFITAYQAYSFLYQIPSNFQCFIFQAIMFDLRAIWDLNTAYLFQSLSSQDRLDFLSYEHLSI